MGKEQPNYYAIIPAEIRYDNRLKANEKLLYGEITALSNKEGYCWSTNKYFADLYGVSEVSVSNWVSSLVEYGYIHRQLIKDPNTKQVKQRRLYLSESHLKKSLGGNKENFNTPIKENFKDNNTSNNNTSNNNIVEQVINYLNNKANTNYRTTTNKTRVLIKARINEGFILDDFIKVIDIKSRDWINDKNMRKYLRPETLFGSKFEGYLNQDYNDTDKEMEDLKIGINL